MFFGKPTVMIDKMTGVTNAPRSHRTMPTMTSWVDSWLTKKSDRVTQVMHRAFILRDRMICSGHIRKTYSKIKMPLVLLILSEMHVRRAEDLSEEEEEETERSGIIRYK